MGIFGINFNTNANKAQQTPVAKKNIPTYTPQYGNYNYENGTTQDLKKATKFEDTLKMASAGKPPVNNDYSNYNDFGSKPTNPEFDMPVAKLNLMG